MLILWNFTVLVGGGGGGGVGVTSFSIDFSFLGLFDGLLIVLMICALTFSIFDFFVCGGDDELFSIIGDLGITGLLSAIGRVEGGKSKSKEISFFKLFFCLT